MLSELFDSKDCYKVEKFEEMLIRYNGYGKSLFSELKSDYPDIFEHLVFYQRIDIEEDCYAIYEKENVSFAIQLEPLCERIVLWNNTSIIEIGNWVTNENEEAIKYIRQNLMDI